MNMKKLMAVVLAVVIAISAMAINVFAAEAETVKIDLFNYGTANDNHNAVTWTFEIPAYALFGYMDYNHYLTLSLPNNLTKKGKEPVDVKWYIEANGAKVQLKTFECPRDENGKPTNMDKYDETIHYVTFGAWAQSYLGEGINAILPQSTAFSQTTPIKIYAELLYNTNDDNSMLTEKNAWEGLPGSQNIKTNYKGDGAGTNTNVYVGLYTFAEGNLGKDVTDENNRLVSNLIYPVSMNITKGGNQQNWYKGINYLNNKLSWDHTLVNRAAIRSAESAKLIVELYGDNGNAASTNGVALYSLKSTLQNGQNYDSYGNGSWWQFDTWNMPINKDWIGVCVVNGKASRLEFDVDMELLYNNTYGVFNESFQVIKQFEHEDGFQLKDGWQKIYNGEPVAYQHKTKDVYLLLTMPAEEEPGIDVQEPVEPGDVNTEPDEPTIDVTEPTTPEEPKEENPPMGIALAVLPMVLAAAAVVTSKKR